MAVRRREARTAGLIVTRAVSRSNSSTRHVQVEALADEVTVRTLRKLGRTVISSFWREGQVRGPTATYPRRYAWRNMEQLAAEESEQAKFKLVLEMEE
jgi:hypothetical protein